MILHAGTSTKVTQYDHPSVCFHVTQHPLFRAEGYMHRFKSSRLAKLLGKALALNSNAQGAGKGFYLGPVGPTCTYTLVPWTVPGDT